MAANVANTKPDGSDHEWVDADGKLGTHAAEGGHIDAAGGQMDAAQLANIHVSDADNKRIRRKTDIALLTCLVWTYFLQTADKTIVGITAVYGLRTDLNLHGNQYSDIGAIGYYAQLVAQPLAAYCLVKFRYRHLMSVLVTLWAVSLLGMAGSRSYAPFMACRFLLGWFEAAAIPLFSIIVLSFYRRSEQPVRIAAWYSQNGMANLISSPIIYGIAKVQNPPIKIYQIVYILFGGITFFTGISCYWWLSDSPGEARYLNDEDKAKAVARLAANQQGVINHKFKPKQVLEAFTEIKLYLFLILTFCINVGASTSSVFGPIILQKVVGFTPNESVLINMPYGVLQTLMILLGSWLAMRFHKKGIILFIFILPTLAGTALLYAVPKKDGNQGPLLAGYYMFAFLYAGNPLILSWLGGNCAGQTKKATYYTAFNAASAVGNIVAPYLFKAKDAPQYHPALTGVFIIFAICAGTCILQILNLMRLQKQKENLRVSMGLPAKLTDYSMENKYKEAGADAHGEKGLEDITDKENPYFIYVL